MKDDPLNRTKVKRGTQLRWSKLSESDVVIIRQLVEVRDDYKKKARELSNKEIAKKFDVHCRTIDRITAGENWTHV